MSIKKKLQGVLFVALAVLLIAGLFFSGTKLEFDSHTARFRVSKLTLGITRQSSIRETWLTQFSINDNPHWESIIIRRSSRPSIWHGVGGSFSARLGGLEFLKKYNYLSIEVQNEIAAELYKQLNNGSDNIDGLIDARDWLDCFMDKLPIPEDPELIPDSVVREYLNQCTDELVN